MGTERKACELSSVLVKRLGFVPFVPVILVPVIFAAGCSTTNPSKDSNQSVSSTTVGHRGALSQITGSDVNCRQFAQGTAPSLEHLRYTSRGTEIIATTPSQFDFWVKVKPTPGTNTVLIKQSAEGTRKLLIQGGMVYSFDAGSCTQVTSTVLQDAHSPSTVTVRFTGTTSSPPTYFLAISVETTALLGETLPSSGRTSLYRYSTEPGSSSAVDLIPG